MVETTQEDDIHMAIVNGMIASTPDTWDEIELDIEYDLFPNGDEGCAHTLYSRQHTTESPEPTEELYDATWQLVLLYKQKPKLWKKAHYRVTRRGEDWAFRVEFTY